MVGHPEETLIMTENEKQLLLKDLLPRQLYGIKAHYQYYDFVGGSERLIHESDGVIKSIDLTLGNPILIDRYHIEVENIKPFLRTMSSMTEEECKEVGKHITIYDTVDWMNEHHFDYHGLIEKGLALEAPEGMYKTE